MKAGVGRHEIIIPLPDGRTLRCGPGDEYQWGGYLRICDKQGKELLYWHRDEWEREGESVIGAVFVSCFHEIRREP